MSILKKLWPLLLALAIFIVVSYFVRQHIEAVRPWLTGSSNTYGMVIYVLLGIATVMIPFGSLTPFVPLATTLWGWPMAAFLTLLGWVLGSQIIFEVARFVGKPVILRFMPKRHLENIGHLIEGQSLARSIFIRMFAHGDIISYAFGIFTKVNRWEFLLVTTVAIAPGAICAAYFGSLPLVYQVSLAAVGIVILGIYWTIETKYPHILRKIGLGWLLKAERELEKI